jgi:hypothetical protein
LKYISTKHIHLDIDSIAFEHNIIKIQNNSKNNIFVYSTSNYNKSSILVHENIFEDTLSNKDSNVFIINNNYFNIVSLDKKKYYDCFVQNIEHHTKSIDDETLNDLVKYDDVLTSLGKSYVNYIINNTLTIETNSLDVEEFEFIDY